MPSKPISRSAARPNPESPLRVRIICKSPPAPQKHGATFGLQDNSSTADWIIHPGQAQPNGDIHFECTCRVRAHQNTGAPSFLGAFVHGDAAKRFLYLSWRPADWRPGQPDSPTTGWVRRIKVHLSSITWKQIEEAAKRNGVLEAVVPGTGNDGGPSCASVPLVGGKWLVKDA